MALKKEILLTSGVTAEYWKLTYPKLENIIISGYKDQEIRESNPESPLHQESIRIDLTEEEKEEVFNYLYSILKKKDPRFADAEDLL